MVSAAGQGAESDREVVLTRVIDAPRELVFDAFTDPKHVDHWWGPNGYKTTTIAMDVRPGGMWRSVMQGPDGTDYDDRKVYEEVVRPERLVYWHGSDVDDDPGCFHVTVTFEDVGGNTRLTMRMLFGTVEQCEAVKGFGAVELGYQTLDRFAAHVRSLA
jgi:uncharacterized protein YndB with AHSA1/START domain